MNSNQHLRPVLIVMGATLLISQLLGYLRVTKLESQVVQLRLELAQQRNSVREPLQRVAQEPESVAPSVQPGVAGLAQHAQERSAERPVQVASSIPLQTTERFHHTTKAQQPVRLASTSHETSGLREMSEEELGEVVAGELGPAPGLAAAATGPSAPLSVEAVNSTESAPQRLATPRVEKGGVLLKRGRTQIEPTLSYSHISKNRVGLSGFSVFDVIFVGEIRAEQVKRDLVTSSLNIRHGVTNNLQVDVELPAQLQREETLSGPVENRQQSISHHYGLNDISGGAFYQFMRESKNFPAMIAHAKLRAPIGNAPRFGSGVWALKSGLVILKTSDPIALFSNIAYTHTFSGQVNHVDVNPGESFEYSVGMSYALNYNLSVNASLEQIIVGQATQNGSHIAGSRLVLASFKTGGTYAINKNLSIDFSVGTGLTEDTPDLTVSISFPYTF